MESCDSLQVWEQAQYQSEYILGSISVFCLM